MDNREALETVRQLQDSLEKVKAEFSRAEKSMRQAAIGGVVLAFFLGAIVGAATLDALRDETVIIPMNCDQQLKA